MFFIISAIILLALFIFVLLFGASTRCRGTSVGYAYDFFMERLPVLIESGLVRLGAGIKYLLGDRIYNKLSGCCGFVLNEKHPIVQLFYLMLITGGLSIFFIDIAPRIPNRYVSNDHWYQRFMKDTHLLHRSSNVWIFPLSQLFRPRSAGFRTCIEGVREMAAGSCLVRRKAV
jgi:hypothetical protein